jgi:FkbM family methyltransferase
VRDYSQNKEQAQILAYFGNAHGRFLSCGENDGETFSNVRALAQLGWSGCCVEPSPSAFAKLQSLYSGERPDIHCVNVAITSQDGMIDLYDSGTHLRKGDTSLLSTTRPEEIARWKKSGETFNKIQVHGITFRTLIEHRRILPQFDFISIDCEGADYDVLKQIDLTAVGCRMLCVEVNARGDAEFTQYAARHGMRLHWSCYENRIFCR